MMSRSSDAALYFEQRGCDAHVVEDLEIVLLRRDEMGELLIKDR